MSEVAQRARGVGVRAAFFEAPLPVKVVLAGIFINRLGSFLNLFLVLYLTSKGYSAEQASVALSVYGAGAVAGVLLGGTLSSKLGPRNATVISMTGTFLIMGSWLYLPSYPVLLTAAAVVSLVGQLYRPASAMLLSELTAHDRQVMTFALYRFGLNLGVTAAPLLGIGLYYLANRHYDLVFWGEALVALGYAILAWVALPARVTPATPATPAVLPAGSREPPDQARRADDAGTPGPAPHAARWSSGYLAMLRDWRYTVFLVAIGVHSAVYIQYLSTLPLNIRSAGVPVYWYTLAVALNGLIVIAFELLVTKVTQSWPMRLSIALTLGLLGVGIALYGLPLGPAVILGGTVVWSLGEIIGGPATFAYPAVIAPARLKGYYIGSFQFMFGLGAAAGPAIGGWLFIRLGHAVWPALALGSATATALVLVAVRQPGTIRAAASTTAPEPTPAPAAHQGLAAE